MSPESIYSWVKADPFVPFRVVMSNGRHYDVRYPEELIVSRDEIIIGELDPDFRVPIPRMSVWVSPRRINTIEPIAAPTPPATA